MADKVGGGNTDGARERVEFGETEVEHPRT